jgi:hypothetical protein
MRPIRRRADETGVVTLALTILWQCPRETVLLFSGIASATTLSSCIYRSHSRAITFARRYWSLRHDLALPLSRRLLCPHQKHRHSRTSDIKPVLLQERFLHDRSCGCRTGASGTCDWRCGRYVRTSRAPPRTGEEGRLVWSTCSGKGGTLMYLCTTFRVFSNTSTESSPTKTSGIQSTGTLFPRVSGRQALSAGTSLMR